MPQRTATKSKSTNTNHRLDKLDFKILDLLALGYTNQQLAKATTRPLSTIQRRSRNLMQSDWVRHEYKPNYQKLGYKTGLVHVYLADGDARSIVNQLCKMEHITNASAHIGNSDIVANYVCKDASQLLQLIGEIKKITGVTKVVWSEQVYEATSQKVKRA